MESNEIKPKNKNNTYNTLEKDYSTNFSQWYNSVIQLADLADNSNTKGCIIFKPYGYSIWENIQTHLNAEIKKSGHQNVYFPLFIPKSYFCKEASHIEGFAKECAIVTHYRLKTENNEIVVDNDAKLQDEYIVRPTSETIIWDTFRKWIKSYRDLPLKINQWANVCRWEMRTRPFLRTSEFLWQEGHTAHADIESAREEAIKMLNIYDTFLKDVLAIPCLKGVKTENEKFAGAEETYTLEALMKDGKALQCATSHLLGKNFSKAFDVKYITNENKLEYVYGTSWGISTRLIGALIMTHGDKKGLVLPPKISPIQVIIIPISFTENTLKYTKDIKTKLENNNIKTEIDTRDHVRPGFKITEWEIKGVPIRIVIGGIEAKNNTLEITRRDTNERSNLTNENIQTHIKNLLEDIQKTLYERALNFRTNHTFEIDNYDEFKAKIKSKSGFIISPWDGTKETELKIKEETQATIRCINQNNENQTIQNKNSICSNNKATTNAIFAINY